MPDSPTQNDLVGIEGEAIVRIVEYNLHKCRDGGTPAPLVEESLPLFGPQAPEFGTAEDELHGVEEVGFSGTVSTDETVHLGGEGVDFGLVFEGAEVGEG